MMQTSRNAGRSFPTLASAAVAAVAAGALLLAARPDGQAADKNDAPPKAATSPLDFVPADAVAVFSVRIADLWDYAPLKAVVEKDAADLTPLRELASQLGVPLDEVDRITVVEETARGPEQQLIAVTTRKPYDKKVILGALAPDAREKDAGDRSYYENPRGQSIAFLPGNTYVLARPEELQSYLKHFGKRDDGPLTPVLQLASEKHVLIAGVDAAAVAAAAPKSEEPPEWIKPLLKAQLVTLTVDLDGEVKASGRVTFRTAGNARDGAAGLNDALDLARGGFVQTMKELTKDGDAPKFTAFMEDVQAAFRSVKAEPKGTAVDLEAALKLDPATTQAALVEGVKKVQKASKRVLVSNDLKQLSLAAMSYADANNVMLPPAVYDKNGKPLLSWRVLVLPYIEQGNLYNQFKLDEPWDSDHNKKLLEKMPATFAPPDNKAFKDHETHFQAVVGKGTVFEKAGLHFPADIPDGTSNTIQLVEAKKAVPWTKPEDVTLDEEKLLPKLGGLSGGGFMASLCDGSVRLFPATMKEETLRIWIIRNSGQVRPDPEK